MGKNIYSERWGKGPNIAEYFDQKKHCKTIHSKITKLQPIIDKKMKISII
jgi:hypothetical protein